MQIQYHTPQKLGITSNRGNRANLIRFYQRIDPHGKGLGSR